MNSIEETILSFRHALRGLRTAAKESNFKIMIAFGLSAGWLTFWLPLQKWEQVVVFFLIGSVITFELINSQVERVLDLIQPQYNEQVKNIKDIFAGAVLVISITSLIVGVLIFLPYLLEVINY